MFLNGGGRERVEENFKGTLHFKSSKLDLGKFGEDEFHIIDF
jgi:hypothetical protein